MRHSRRRRAGCILPWGSSVARNSISTSATCRTSTSRASASPSMRSASISNVDGGAMNNSQSPGQPPGVIAGQELRDRLRDRITGFRTTQMIHVAAKLGLADLLADGPRRPGELAAAVGAEPQALYRLLRALAGLGIFAENDDGAFALTPQAALLRAGVPGSLHS